MEVTSKDNFSRIKSTEQASITGTNTERIRGNGFIIRCMEEE